MKKSIQLLAVLFTFLSFSACQSGGESSEAEAENVVEVEEVVEEVVEEPEADEESGLKYSLDLDASTLNWEAGKKFVESGHNGTLNFKGGKLIVNEGQLLGGVLIVDMTTIKSLDLEGTDSEEKLVNHLNSNDFFSVDEFPEAVFKLSTVEENESEEYSHLATGELIIKGISNEVNFPLNIKFDESLLEAAGELIFDRTNFDVKYGSDKFFDIVRDKVIDNDVKLKFNLKASAV